MTQAAKSQEPSMEEILASIRRIIADDDAKPSPAATAAPAPPPAPPAVPAPPVRQSAPPPPAPPKTDPSSILRDAAMRQDDIDNMMKEQAAAKPKPAVEPPSDVLNLTESMITTPPQASPPAAANFQTIDGEPDVVFKDEPEPEPAPVASPLADLAYTDSSRPARAPERPLISNSTSAMVDSAFNTLAHTVLVQNARTLEDLVREMLRPMLKTWLDDNLPGIVERLVRAEIERVSRGRN